MKIEIDWDCSYKATLKIDGREMTVDLKPGITSLNGIKAPETNETLGGLIAQQLYGKIGDFMQAEANITDIIDPAGERKVTWEKLPDEAIEEFEKRVW